MSKIYRYEDLSYTGDKNEEIIFKVKMISNGNIGRTIVDPPSTYERVILDSGEASLGTLKNLTASRTAAYSNVNNPTPIADDIIVEYYINDTLLVRHENSKQDSEDPLIILKIKCIAQ